MKKFFLLFILFISHQSVFSQENALLWEISKKRHKTSYLFGSIHSDNAKVLAFGDKVLPYLYTCESYAGEIIIQAEDMFAMLPYLFEKDSTKQCGKILSPEEMTAVIAAVEQVIGSELNKMIPLMSPYIVASLIANPNETKAGSEVYFLDVYLQEMAEDVGLELISLESIESQMSYIQKIDGEEQKKHLLEMIGNLENVETEMAEMIELYLAQDLGKIKEMLETAPAEDPLFTEGFMEERNLLQTEGIMEAMKSSSVFVVIGAAHLPGDQGVIQLLLDAGFTLKPVVGF